jgi:hypothetical protein
MAGRRFVVGWPETAAELGERYRAERDARLARRWPRSCGGSGRGSPILQQVTWTLSDLLIGRGTTVNTVNPGPTDSGWASPKLRERVRGQLPLGRWGEPGDAARLIAWLCTDDAAWVTGQVINSEGGLRRA